MPQKRSIALAVVALIGAGFVGSAITSEVEAQSRNKSPVILVVNRAQIVAQSKAGQTIPDQARRIQEDVSKELEAEAEKLKSDIEKFQKNQSLMSEEVRQKEAQALTVRQQVSLPQQAQIMEQAYATVVDNATNKVLLETQPILKEIVDKRGATVLLDRSAVMYAAPETDVTSDVIKELDKKLKKVDVEKITLADVKKRLEEFAAQQRQAAAQANKK